MAWVIFVAGAVLSWGAYGALLHQGQMQLGNPLKALLCVGLVYFLIGVLVPVAGLSAQGNLSGFNTGGLITATIAGALGAAGASSAALVSRAKGIIGQQHTQQFGKPRLRQPVFSRVTYARRLSR